MTRVIDAFALFARLVCWFFVGLIFLGALTVGSALFIIWRATN